MGPDGTHPSNLRELAELVVKLLSILSEKSAVRQNPWGLENGKQHSHLQGV